MPDMGTFIVAGNNWAQLKFESLFSLAKIPFQLKWIRVGFDVTLRYSSHNNSIVKLTFCFHMGGFQLNYMSSLSCQS